MNDKCKNCGGNKSIHHYQTNQCPIGGREAPLGQKEEYMMTTFEPDNSDELEETVDELKSESDLAETVRIWGTGE
jgi:hypothetical protein